MKNKIICLGASVLFILLAISPAISSVKLNDFDVSSNVGSLEIVSCVYNTVNPNEPDLAVYKLEIEITVFEDYKGPLELTFDVDNSPWIKTFPTSDYTFIAGYAKTILIDVKVNVNDENKFAQKTFTLAVEGNENEQSDFSFNIIKNSGNVITKYWRNDKDYNPTKTHLELTSPNDNWIDYYETFSFDDGSKIQLPVFKNLYITDVFVNPALSDKMGWFGELADLFVEYLKNLSIFLSKFCHVLADVVFIIIELGVIGATISAYFTQVSLGIPLTLEQIGLLLLEFAALFATIADLLQAIQDLPIDEDSPERIGLGNAREAIEKFLARDPWYDDIIIKGSVQKCKSGEDVTLACRNVKNEKIPGGGGERKIDSIPVSSIHDPDTDGFRGLFRLCQVSIKGNMHKRDPPTTPKAVSYVAPGGSLHCTFGFNGGIAKNKQILSLFEVLLHQFPFLKCLQRFFANSDII